MSRLLGKRALITGGTSGIGFATAKRFIEEGARVAITGNNQAALDNARGQLNGDVVAIRSDAADVGSQMRLSWRIHEEFDTLDILFINAGAGDFRPIGAWDEAGFDRAFATNVKGPFFLVQALMPCFANPAAIVLNGSVNAHIGKSASSVYAASKAALISLARTLSGELASRSIRVNVVSPGPVATPIYEKLGLGKNDLEAMKSSLLAEIAAGRFGDPIEIANAVVYLASDESRYTIGSELIVDGGMTTL